MFKKLYKKYPHNPEIPYFMGSCLMNDNNFESALVYFRICLTLDPAYNKNIYIYMAICLKSQSKFEQAISVLDLGLDRYSRFKDAYFYKGKLYMKMK